MPFYEDFSSYQYRDDPASGDVFNVGWLGRGHEFPVGDVPAGFVDRLARLALRHPVNRMRGWQACPFCEEEEYPAHAKVDGERHPVGDAEIRVSWPGGRIYAAPTLVAHYVGVHRYRPPDEFVDAVLADVRAAAFA